MYKLFITKKGYIDIYLYGTNIFIYFNLETPNMKLWSQISYI